MNLIYLLFVINSVKITYCFQLIFQKTVNILAPNFSRQAEAINIWKEKQR